ncbi:MAG: right-handed parallel beta-helix repeat-containing protein, partial [Verrucomicrobiales bacterium]|nr:right-handed parallel beta-helix repeat-containing protein [Verrucomicrobiales bacterium]
HDGSEGAQAPAPGDWESLIFSPGSSASVVEHLEVRFAGMTNPGNRDFRDAISIQQGGTFRFLRVLDSANHAIRVLNQAAPVLEDVDVRRSGGVPFYFTLAAKPVLTRLSASDNATEGIWIDGGTIVLEQAWTYVGMPYFLTTNVAVDAGITLTLGAGTMFRMAAGARFDVSGTLLAKGTPEAPIILTSYRDDSAGGDAHHDGSEGNQAPTPGDWETLAFALPSGASVLEHVEIRYPGMTNPGNRDFRDGLLIQTSAQFRNIRVRDTASNGIRVLLEVAPVLDTVDVQRSGGVPFYFALAARPVLTRLSASNNATEGIWIDGGAISGAQAWTYVGIPYFLTTNLVVDTAGTLTLGPGTIVRMAPGAYLSVTGKLLVNGTAEAPVILTSAKDDSAGGDAHHDGTQDNQAPQAGDWQSLQFNTGSDASVVQHLEVRYAGMTAPRNNDLRNTIQIGNSASPTLRNVRIRFAASHGVRVETARPILENIDVRFGQGVPFYFALAADPIVSGLTASDNKTEGLWIDGGQLVTPRRWAVTSMPYLVTTNLRIGADATLTLGPGVVVKMAPGAWLAANGKLVTEGTLEAPVILTAQKDDSAGGDTFHDGNTGTAAPRPGDWQAIYFETGSTDSVLNYTDIRYAGQTAPNNNDSRPSIDIAAGLSPTLRNVRIRDGFSHAIYAKAGSSPVLRQVHAENSRGFALVLDMGTTPVIEGVTGSGNANNAIYIGSGQIQGDRTWDYGPLPLWIGGNLRLATDAKLTVAPGTVVKMSDGAWVALNGNLQALGTAERPIVWTSIHDDAAGGDSNGNGSASTPIRGSWQAFYFENGSSPSVLDHVVIRYPGQTSPNNNDPRPAIDIAAELTPTLRNLVVEDAFDNGMNIAGGAKPLLESVQVRRVGRFVLSLANSADPVVRNLTGTSNGLNAIFVASGTFGADRTWDYGTLPIWLGGNLRVGANTKFTIAPGTVVKVADGAWIAINGTLQARGTADRPIVITGIRDDSAGGDSNGNGSASTATPGDWQSIYVEPPSTGSVLEYAEIRFAGETSPRNNDRRPTISLSGIDLVLRNTRITQGAGMGIQIDSGALLTLSDSIVADFRETLLNVANGTATVTATLFTSAPTAVHVARGEAAKASVTGSAFLALSGTAVTHAGTDFGKALFTSNWWGNPNGPHDPSDADGRRNDNPAGAAVSDYVDYTGPLASRPILP